MTARRAAFERVIDLYCDTCRAEAQIEVLNITEARRIAAAEAGWWSNGMRDFCATCAAKPRLLNR